MITIFPPYTYLYHSKGVGINPEDFGITQSQLDEI